MRALVAPSVSASMRDLRFIVADSAQAEGSLLSPRRQLVRSLRPLGFHCRVQAIRVCYSKRGDEEVVNKISDVHIARLLPWQASRTWLRRSRRSRKQSQPGLHRLRSERYPFQ
jgi:hypothetical protein